MTGKSSIALLIAIILFVVLSARQALAQTPAQTQTASELLQKGIYLQETVGDLNGAIKTFRQVAHMANESRAIGAQAEYRLGLCLQKEGRQTEANKIFQDLIANYSDQSEIVSRTRALVASTSQLELLPAPWKDGESLELVHNLPDGRPLNIYHYSIASSKNNPSHWLIEHDLSGMVPTQFQVDVAGTSWSQVEVEGETMKPIFSADSFMLGDSQTTYHGSEARVEMKDKETTVVQLDGPVWDSVEVWALLRRLPLAPGYKTTLPILSSPGGISKRDFEVTGTADVKTPAGVFHCYRVEEKPLLQTFFISADDSRYLVKIETATGSAELEKISYGQAGPVTYTDKRFGFSLIAPEGWRIYNLDDKIEGLATLIDPEFQASVGLIVLPLGADDPVTAEGMRERIEKEIQNGKRNTADGKTTRSDTWQTRQIGGRLAFSWIVDYTDPFGKKSTLYSIEIQGDQDTAVFLSKMAAGSDIVAFQKRLDPIIASLTMK